MTTGNSELTKQQQGHITPYVSKILIAAGILFGLALVIIFLGAIFRVLMLILAGILICVFFRGIGNWVAKKTGIKSGWATFFAIVLTFVIVGGAVWLLAPTASKQLSDLREQLPQAISQLKTQFGNTALGEELLGQDFSLKSMMKGEGKWLQRITGVFSTTLTFVTYFFVILILGFLFSSGPKTYTDGLVSLFPKPRRKRAREVVDTLGNTLLQWLMGKMLSMLIVAIMTSIGLWLIGIPMAIVLGLIAGLLAFIPNFGPLISLIPAILMALLQGPVYILYVVVLYIGVQVVESNLLLPVIQKRMVEMPMAIVVIAQLVMGALTGIMGLILATPVAAVLIVLVKMLYVEDVLKDQDVEIQAQEKN